MDDLNLLEEILLDTCPDLAVCNCSGCGFLLVSDEARRNHPHHSRGIRPVHVRHRGRPFCSICFAEGELNRIDQLHRGPTHDRLGDSH